MGFNLITRDNYESSDSLEMNFGEEFWHDHGRSSDVEGNLIRIGETSLSVWV